MSIERTENIVPSTILLADDHAIFIQGLKAMLQGDERYKVVMDVRNGNEVLRVLSGISVDILILDLNMPGLDGFETLLQLREKKIKVKVVVLSGYRDPKIVKRLKSLGASAMVNKARTEEELFLALEAVSEGKEYFPEILEENEELSDSFIKRFKLTPRELEVLALVAQEMTSKEIADKLFISEETAKTHRKNLVRKLQVKGVAGLVKFAMEFGLV